MDALRTEAGEISTLSADSPVRKQFDLLHLASTRVEGAVLILGIVLLYLTTRKLSAAQRARSSDEIIYSDGSASAELRSA
jgi:hypothetical protein